MHLCTPMHSCHPHPLQTELFLLQKQQEDSFMRLCRCAGKPAVVICDRGLLDGKVLASLPETTPASMTSIPPLQPELLPTASKNLIIT